ncbi:MAG: LacI family DNA-binding transcriptional regulator [Micropruina sp.]
MGKRATLADVAARVGMSITAVSMVLNDRPGARLSADSARRIRAAARDLEYVPNSAARSLRVGKTGTIGFISDSVAVTRFASAMIRGVTDVADQHELAVLITETGSSRHRLDRAMRSLLDRRPDGVIFALMGAKEVDVPRLPRELPVVLVNAISPQSHPAVLPAEFEAGQSMARLLLDAGHTRIVLIGHDDALWYDRRLSATMGARFAGLFSALAEADVELVATHPGEYWEPKLGYTGLNRLLDAGHDVTAVIAMNDRVAFGVYQAAQERGLRIPSDLSVVSFDDEEIASYLRPGLTTARIPYEEMGRVGMEMVLGLRPAGNTLVPMPIVVRDSVRPPA